MSTNTTTLINGIDTQALLGTIEAVREDSTRGLAGFHVTTRWTGGTGTESTIDHWTLGGARLERTHIVRTDEPIELCGQNRHANPQEVLMSALNGCMTVGYIALFALHGIEVESLSIETKGTLDLRGFLGLDGAVNPGYDDVEYTVRVRANGSPEQIEEIHRIVMATSPNFANFSRPITLKPRLVVDAA